ncbi:fibronectin type III domain-containing protein [Aquimarina sp. 2201CG1-2-11]|uniref:fibronectin type III domain-containing protein n=1 Tax=Aquimarina discodermiae TaxID=3231043 RepID=UPI003461F58E
MKNKIILLFACLFVFYSGLSQEKLWERNFVRKARTDQGEPSSIASYNLNLDGLKAALSQSPKIGKSSGDLGIIISIPDENGDERLYRFIEKSNFHPDLAKKFSTIKSYSGVSVDGSQSSVHISISSNKLSGVIIDSKNSKNQFIKKQNNGNIYTISSALEGQEDQVFQCGNTHNENDAHVNHSTSEKKAGRSAVLAGRNANDATLRTFRLALATTAEFSNFYINRANVSNGTNQQKKAAVLAGLNDIMTRINAVYERDLSVRFQLIANNDDVIFLNTNTDGLTHNNSSTLFNEAHGVISNAVGNGNFDIGHVLDLSNNGGFGNIGSICRDTRKGSGTSTGLAPEGNFFNTLLLHELGHQLGANHTWNSCNNNGGRANFNAVEPGSGSSIMSYGGICGANNVVGAENKGTYFHARSIEEMWAVVSNTGCGTNTNTGNAAPTANAGADFTIPKSTPFVLRGTGNDNNNPANSLTYTWEQMDSGIEVISPYGITGPAFRSVSPSSSPERYFPAISGVASGFVSPWESLPAVSRDMNFRLTVRDNNNGGGSNASDDMKVTVNDDAGPFVVSSPNTDQIIWTPGSNQNITWNVAGTTGNGINAATVDILLSTDGGNTFGTTLASNVPNDGSHQITVPNSPGSLNRIMVRGTNHIFYDISDKSFFISNGSDTTPPSRPIGLTATNPASTSNIAATLSWTPSTDNVGVAGYIIVQNGEEVFTWNNQNTSELVMRGLDDGTQYSFQVIAFDAAGNRSVASAVATVTTTGNAPTAPQNVVATNITQTGVTLNWSSSTSSGTNIDGYSVFVNGVFTLYTKDVTPNNLTFAQLNTLTPGRTYSITVGAVDGNNVRSRKNSIPIEVTTIGDNFPPSTPINLTATAPIDQNENPQTAVDLSWTASTDNIGIGGYIIVQNGEEVFTWNNTSTAITMRSLTPGTQYTYQIIAFDTAGNRSGLSTSATVTTAGVSPVDTTPPTTPTNLTATAPQDQNENPQTAVDLNWTASTDNIGVTGYIIVQNGQEVFTWNSTSPAITMRSLTPNTQYTFQIIAFDAAGNRSNRSASATITTASDVLPGDTTPPSNVTNLQAGSITQTTANLTWNVATDNVGVTGYDIFRGTEATALATSTTNSFQLTGLTPATTTTYVVKAKDAAGNTSVNNSNTVTVTTLGVGNPTYCAAGRQGTNYIAQVTFGAIDNSSNNGSYSDFTSQSTSVQRGQSLSLTITPGFTATNWTRNVVAGWIDWNRDGTFSTAERVLLKNPGVGGQTTTVTVPNDAQFGSTRLRVRYRWASEPNPCGTSTSDGDEVEDYTVVVANGNEDTTAPTVPTNLTATAPQDQNEDPQTAVDLTWTASTDNVGVTGYVIVQNGQEVFTWNNTSPAITMRSLTPNTQYTFQIIAFDAAGNRSNRSASATITTASDVLPGDTTPPSNVANLQAGSITQTTANLTWNVATDNVGVTGYDIFRGTEATAFATSTTNSFQLTGLTPATTTTYVVKAKDAAGNTSVNNSNTVSVTTTGTTNPTPTYCAATANDGPEGISNVTFAGINNSSVRNASGYDDFTSISATVSAGSSHNLSVDIIGYQGGGSDEIYAFFDWNRDGDFADGDESFTLTKTTNLRGDVSVTVPQNAVAGDIRMRLLVSYYNAENNPCDTGSNDVRFGEYEDYTINITAAKSITTTQKPFYIVYENPVKNEKLNIGLNNAANGSAVITLYTIAGRKVLAHTSKEGENTIGVNVSELAQGMYVARIEQGNEKATARIIIDRK